MMDDGVVTLCRLVDVREPGNQPKEVLRAVSEAYFARRIVGVTRQYAAMGVSQRIDALIRIWACPVEIGMYAVLSQSELDGQYRIDSVQPLTDYDGLKVTDLTLSKVENCYDLDTEA